MQNFLYIFKEGLKGFQRAKLSSFLAVVTVFLSVLLVGGFYLFSINLNQMISSIKARLEIEIFIDNSYNAEKTKDLQYAISLFNGIKQVKFISKEDAAEVLKRDFGKDVLSILDDNPLPASFQLQLFATYQQADSARKLVEQLEGLNGIDEVVYRKDILLLLDRYLNRIMLAILIVGLIVASGSLFFIYNTIRLIITSRREIIEVMKLVGATPGFIRLPFLIEGLFQAFSGTLIALGGLYLFSLFIHSQVSQFVFLSSSSVSFLLIGGSIVGLAGSGIAISRFLKY